MQEVILSAMGGMNITHTVEGRERYPVNLRYGRELRDNLPALRRVLVATPTGAQIPIGQVADLRIRKGPPGIKSENARLNAWVYIDIRDVDVGTYVERAREIVGEEIDLPQGYSLVWSGQYEYMERAKERLSLVVPVTLAIIFLLLFLHFRSVVESLMVMLTLPFALVGGIWLIYLLDYNMSVAVGVGFIALAGVSAELGVVMLTYLDQALEARRQEGPLESPGDLAAAIVEGASRRVRPIFMTVGSTVGGLLPIMWATGTGSQVMKRIAAPMVGGLATATLLALLVLPAVYELWRGREVVGGRDVDSEGGGES